MGSCVSSCVSFRRKNNHGFASCVVVAAAVDCVRRAFRGIEMDFIYIALIIGFFVLSAGLIRFCATLMDKGGKS
jgi:hypothetical protein